MSELDSHKPDHSPISHSSSSSYIYPVRSLLTGIQPATTAETPRPSIGRPRKSSSSGDLTALHDRLSSHLGRTDKSSTSSPERKTDSYSRSKFHQSRHSMSSNFRDFAPEENPFTPRTFVSASPPLSPPSEDQQPLHATCLASGLFPVNPVVKDSVDNLSIPIQLDYVVAPAFQGENYIFPQSRPPLVSRSTSSTCSNMSQSGIVHLDAVGSTASSSRASCSDQGSAAQSSRMRFSTGSVASSNQMRSRGFNQNAVGSSGSNQSSKPASFNHASSEEPSEHPNTSSSSGNLSLEEDLVNVRYQHAEDENGHHVVIGREGHIIQCEDEPIRTPGAVQGFGVLIVVTENEEAETLVVRQVSENSSALLGLSPKYLFSLECFTDILSESQADMLWDNIQSFSSSWSTREESGDSPHVFLLSGRGEPGSDISNNDALHRREWTCWCAVHRPSAPEGQTPSTMIIMEFELERDSLNPLYPPPQCMSATLPSSSGSDKSGTTLSSMTARSSVGASSDTASDGSEIAKSVQESADSSSDSGDVQASETLPWMPTPEEILESTTSRSKPLLALERLRRMNRPSVSKDGAVSANGSPRRRAGRSRSTGGVVGMMDVFAIMAQITEQLGDAADLDTFLKVVVGVIKDLTQFHRVLVYQFDEEWNGQVVSELVDWSRTHELFKGLHFPAGDIPAQARHLYTINRVRLLYDRGLPTARLVVRSKEDLDTPLDMTHCYLRAMSPIHLKYLENMGVRASMSVSIMAFGALWGLVTCHSYGPHGMRVSFPVRQMLRLLSQSISKNLERLSYAQRLRTRKLINTMPSDQHPGGYIVSNADDLLGLFDADYGVLVIGEGAKILGPNEHGQEILIVAEYLRLKQFDVAQVSQAVTSDFPDLQLSTGLEVIAGLLYVPLSSGGRDFIAFLRKGQPREVHWAGMPFRDGKVSLEPRSSFKMWSEITTGKCRAWTDEQLETAGVLALVYGKFIEVWRQKESALQRTKLTNLLLSNASHEVRTPLNHIINYLELALNGPLDGDTRENLSESHAASKSLLFTINDLLDLTRLESGQETTINEPFDLHRAIEEAIHIYQNEAQRRNLGFEFNVSGPKYVVGDSKKIRTVVANLTANALKYSAKGTITVECRAFGEPEGLRDSKSVAVEIVISDNGCGICPSKLESIFREFEQVESTSPKMDTGPGLGLGLAVVARIVEQLGGQLRVDSKVDEGSRFSLLIPFDLPVPGSIASSSSSSSLLAKRSSVSGSELDGLVTALQTNHLAGSIHTSKRSSQYSLPASEGNGTFEVEGSARPIRPVKVDEFEMDAALSKRANRASVLPQERARRRMSATPDGNLRTSLRVLVVEDNEINSKLLGKRLALDGHAVEYAMNGQQGVDVVSSDREFDCILMDIQMPLLNGFEATEQIRVLEEKGEEEEEEAPRRRSHLLNGRIPIFAVSASLLEEKKEEMARFGLDGWILKPIDFKRLRAILLGITDPEQRKQDLYHAGCNWESGGWFTMC